MITLDIPGMASLELEHLLLDYNGTLAVDGVLKTGVLPRLEALSQHLRIHVLTADTYGSVQRQCGADFLQVHVIGALHQDCEKLHYLETLGSARCIVAGNGRNDRLMLQKAALGFAVLQEEGLSIETLTAADALFRSIEELLDSLAEPRRLVATLRN